MKELLQGNDAAALGAIYAGCRFFAGYPITPSTEIAEKMALLLPKYGGRFIQMEDELAAMAAVVGASVAGVKSLTATSGPGFSLKQENLGFAYITEIPCVVADVQRGGPSTGLPTAPSQSDLMQARWGTHGDHPSIAVYPSTVYEQFSEMVRAFNLSEKYRIPVIFLSDEIIGHMRECVVLPKPGELQIFNRVKPAVAPEDYKPYDSSFPVPPMANFGDGYRYHITGLSHDETGFPTNNGAVAEKMAVRHQRKIDDNYDDIVKVEEFLCSDGEIIVFAAGAAARSAKEAVIAARKEGVRAGLFKPFTIWPFPDKHIKNFEGRIKRMIVSEMNLGQLSNEVERAAGGFPVSRILQGNGEPITPDRILSEILSSAK
jgi:2-oxoglutarate ferredoxin oxidoreductase subunit alpha